MILKIALSYILGIFAESVFNLDLLFLGFIIFMGFIILYLRKTLDLQGVSKGHYVFYAIFMMSFMFGVLYTKYEIYNSTFVSYPNSLYEITGKIISVNETINSKSLILKTENITNLSDNSLVSNDQEYIKILVSPSNTVGLFDTISFQSDLQDNIAGKFTDNTKLFSFY